MQHERLVVIGSIFRNSTHYLDRYFNQLNGLRSLLADHAVHLTPILVEGDSTDHTLRELTTRTAASGGGVVTVRNHGGPVFGSVDHPQRWRQLAHACNGVLESMSMLTVPVDALIYVESDLAWKPETMIRLLHHVGVFSRDAEVSKMVGSVPAVAPFCFTGPQGLDGPRGFFYDIWGHIGDNGVNFNSLPPYHVSAPAFDETGALPLVPINSAGSCVVVGAPIVHDILSGLVRFSDTDCIRGYCRAINAVQYSIHGHGLYLDPGAEVRHL